MNDRQPRRRQRRPANRIVGLVTRTLAGGLTAYYWMPSPTLRRAGYRSVPLGTDRAAAIAQAETINQAVAIARAAPNLSAPSPTARQGVHSFADLVHAYRQSDEWRRLKPKTQREYRSRIGWLLRWADDGALPIIAITDDVCHTLRDTLVASDSVWNAAAKLRLLRILLGWASHKRRRLLAANPATGLDVPTPAPRRKRMAIDALDALVAAGDAVIGPSMGLAILLGFYTVQRESDLLAATRFNWRASDDIAAIDRAMLAGPDGRVMALRLRQHKTGAPVDAFVPPAIAARVTACIAARGADYTGPLLVEDDWDGAPREWRERYFQRSFRTTIDAAITAARANGDNWLVDQLHGLQFRDLRRSGMCWLRDCGATIAQIASISGHSIKYTTKILDTYLPADTRTAAAGMAHALRSAPAAQQRTG